MQQFLLQNLSDPNDFLQALRFEFDTDAFDVSIQATAKNVYDVRIYSQNNRMRGSQTSIFIHVTQTERGLEVSISDQEWGQIAASLGTTVAATFFNPINIIHRLDDLAVDVQNMQLGERVENFVREYNERKAKAAEFIDDKALCKYCHTRNNPPGSHCISCGAPL